MYNEYLHNEEWLKSESQSSVAIQFESKTRINLLLYLKKIFLGLNKYHNFAIIGLLQKNGGLPASFSSDNLMLLVHNIGKFHTELASEAALSFIAILYLPVISFGNATLPGQGIWPFISHIHSRRWNLLWPKVAGCRNFIFSCASF